MFIIIVTLYLSKIVYVEKELCPRILICPKEHQCPKEGQYTVLPLVVEVY